MLAFDNSGLFPSCGEVIADSILSLSSTESPCARWGIKRLYAECGNLQRLDKFGWQIVYSAWIDVLKCLNVVWDHRRMLPIIVYFGCCVTRSHTSRLRQVPFFRALAC